MVDFTLTAENNWIIFAFIGFFVLILLTRVFKARRLVSSVTKDSSVGSTVDG